MSLPDTRAVQGLPVYVEMAEGLASSNGLSAIVRAKLHGGQLARIAYIFIRGGRLWAECPLIRPVIVGDREIHGCNFALTRHLDENAE